MQTHRFYEKHVASNSLRNIATDNLNLETFKMWLDQYPFIRTLIREALMPRVWTLQKITAVPSAKAGDGSMHSASDVSATTLERSSSSASSLSKAGVADAGFGSNVRRTKSGAEGGFAYTEDTNTLEKRSYKIGCIMPKDSRIGKEGE